MTALPEPLPSFPETGPPRPDPPGRHPRAAQAVVRLSEPGDVAAAVPHLLGFHPQESVVLVSLTGPGGRRVGLTVRADIPPPAQAAGLARALTRSIRTDEPDGVLVAVVSEAPDAPGRGPADETGEGRGGDDAEGRRAGERDADAADLPHRFLVHQLVLALDAAGIPVRDALLVRRGRWWSYDCPHPCCHPRAGTPLPDGTSQLAAAGVLSGSVVAPSRDALEQRIAAATGPERAAAARATLTVAAARAARARQVGWAGVADEAWTAIRAALDGRRPGAAGATTRLTAEEVAQVTWGLRDIAVRDRALQLALGAEDAAAEALWTECVRRTVPPLDAAPAALLAVSAWLRGDGALANVALERALDSDPDYSLAHLLRKGLAACVPPGELRAMLTDAAAHRADRPGPGR